MPRPKQKRPAKARPLPDVVDPARRATGTKRGPGRPPIHDEDWTKVTVVLFDRQIVYLDGVAGSVRANTGAAISRAQLIRALVDAVAEARIDLTQAPSEAEMKSTVLARFAMPAETRTPAARRRPSRNA